jgi:aquaporin Z
MGESPSYSKYVAEFVGTYLLVFTVGCNVLGMQRTGGDGIWVATSIACVLMVSIYALGGISGANFNPAVSLTLAVSGYLDWVTASIYMGVQVLGGIAAGFSYTLLWSSAFNCGPSPGFTWISAGVAELLYTFMLCFVVLNVACSSRSGNCPNQFYGLAIGFVIVAGGYGAGAVSGGCFNPAVAIGIDASSPMGKDFKFFGMSMVYMCFEFLGALLASGLHRVVRPQEYGGDEPTLVSKLVSEFLGTFYLVLTVCFNVYGGSKSGAWSIAASLMCMIYALGNVSGAHFNPAVTVAIVLSGRGKMEGGIAAAGAYIVVQVLGGIAAATVVTFTMGRAHVFGPVGTATWGQVAVAEIMFTFVLCFVVLCVATTREPSKDMFGLAIGSCVTVGGLAIGSLSGGSLNPAVSFGLDTANAIKGGGWMNCLVYSALEFAGAAIAASVFFGTHPTEYIKGAQSGRFLRERESYGSLA